MEAVEAEEFSKLSNHILSADVDVENALIARQRVEDATDSVSFSNVETTLQNCKQTSVSLTYFSSSANPLKLGVYDSVLQTLNFEHTPSTHTLLYRSDESLFREQFEVLTVTNITDARYKSGDWFIKRPPTSDSPLLLVYLSPDIEPDTIPPTREVKIFSSTTATLYSHSDEKQGDLGEASNLIIRDLVNRHNANFVRSMYTYLDAPPATNPADFNTALKFHPHNVQINETVVASTMNSALHTEISELLKPVPGSSEWWFFPHKSAPEDAAFIDATLLSISARLTEFSLDPDFVDQSGDGDVDDGSDSLSLYSDDDDGEDDDDLLPSTPLTSQDSAVLAYSPPRESTMLRDEGYDTDSSSSDDSTTSSISSESIASHLSSSTASTFKHNNKPQPAIRNSTISSSGTPRSFMFSKDEKERCKHHPHVSDLSQQELLQLLEDNSSTPTTTITPIFVRFQFDNKTLPNTVAALSSFPSSGSLAAYMALEDEMQPLNIAVMLSVRAVISSFAAAQTLQRLSHVSTADIDVSLILSCLRNSVNVTTTTIPLHLDRITNSISAAPQSDGASSRDLFLEDVREKFETTMEGEINKKGRIYWWLGGDGEWGIMRIRPLLEVFEIKVFDPGKKERVLPEIEIVTSVVTRCHQIWGLRRLNLTRTAEIIMVPEDRVEVVSTEENTSIAAVDGNETVQQQHQQTPPPPEYNGGDASDSAVASDETEVVPRPSQGNETLPQPPVETTADLACPLKFSTIFPLNHRCKLETTILSLQSSVLHPFAVSNRANLFVYKDANDDIFYLRLESHSLGGEDEDESIQLLVYGVVEPGISITEQLVEILRTHIDSVALNSLSNILRNNTQFSVADEDVEFLMSFSSDSHKSTHYQLPPIISDPMLYLLYVRQNICSSGYVHSLSMEPAAQRRLGFADDVCLTPVSMLYAPEGDVNQKDSSELEEPHELGREVQFESKDFTIYYNHNAASSKMNQGVSTLTEKGSGFFRSIGAGMAIVRLVLENVSNVRVGVLPTDSISAEEVFAVDACKGVTKIDPSSDEADSGAWVIRTEVINTTVNEDSLLGYLEFCMNQSLLDYVVERMLLASKLGLLRENRVLFALPENAPVGTSQLSTICDYAQELNTLSVRTVHLQGYFKAISVKKFFDEILSNVIHDFVGAGAVCCESHTSEHSTIDSPTYCLYYGLTPTDEELPKTNLLLYDRVDIDLDDDRNNQMRTILRELAKQSVIFSRNLAVLFTCTRESRKLQFFNVHPDVYQKVETALESIHARYLAKEEAKADTLCSMMTRVLVDTRSGGRKEKGALEAEERERREKERIAEKEKREREEREKERLENEAKEKKSSRPVVKFLRPTISFKKPTLVGASVDGAAMHAVLGARSRARVGHTTNEKIPKYRQSKKEREREGDKGDRGGVEKATDSSPSHAGGDEAEGAFTPIKDQQQAENDRKNADDKRELSERLKKQSRRTNLTSLASSIYTEYVIASRPLPPVYLELITLDLDRVGVDRFRLDASMFLDNIARSLCATDKDFTLVRIVEDAIDEDARGSPMAADGSGRRGSASAAGFDSNALCPPLLIGREGMYFEVAVVKYDDSDGGKKWIRLRTWAKRQKNLGKCNAIMGEIKDQCEKIVEDEFQYNVFKNVGERIDMDDAGAVWNVSHLMLFEEFHGKGFARGYSLFVDIDIFDYVAKTGGGLGNKTRGGGSREEGGVWLCGAVEEGSCAFFLFGREDNWRRGQLGGETASVEDDERRGEEKKDEGWTMRLFVVGGDDAMVGKTHGILNELFGKAAKDIERDMLWSELGRSGGGLDEGGFIALCEMCAVANVAKEYDVRVGDLMDRISGWFGKIDMDASDYDERREKRDIVWKIGSTFSVVHVSAGFLLVVVKQGVAAGLFAVEKTKAGGSVERGDIERAIEDFVNRALCRMADL
jgi:hypothetical protein